MILETIRKRRRICALIALILCINFTVMVFFYRGDYIIYPSYQVDAPTLALRSRHRKVLLPAGFQFPNLSLKNHLKLTSGKDWEVYQLKDWETRKLPPLEPGRFKTTEFFLYKLSENTDCNRKENMKIGTDESEKLSLNLTKVFEIFREENEVYNDSYNRHILPLFERYIEPDKFGLHWFRFSGSSVWLKDFNVHFVVSRLVFTENSLRENPRVSVLLAQIFDEQWQEIEDVRLVFPTNDLENSSSFRIKEQSFILERFPRIIPVPISVGETGLYWGAEDPRMTLVKHKNRYEEPIIVFNAYQGKEVVTNGESKVEGFRSIFISFPFQRQRGKHLMPLGNDSTKDDIFIRTNQVMIEGSKESRIEKNWSPFVSSAGEYNSHVYFATLLAPLKVIKCKLWVENSKCSVEKDEGGGRVGALRGGTPLISLKKMENEDKEFFFGLARAHLTNCGCGGQFYRPNLVVVVRNGSKWSLSHVSSSIDLGMKVIPWPQGANLCEGVDAMIPNGIEWFDRERDLLSVDLSISDATVERVTIHGLLKALEKAKYWEEEAPEHTISPVKCAMEASVEFCKNYGAQFQKRGYNRDFTFGFE